MVLIRDEINKIFEIDSESFRRKWENRPVEFLMKKCGRKYPKKYRRIFESIYFYRILNAIFLGPRGGGKTVMLADIATCKYLFKLADVLFLGGSKNQAEKGYQYASENLNINHEELIDFGEEPLTTLAKSNYGNWIKFAACSTTAIRGEHCGNPHHEMNNNMEAHEGMMILDEECEVKKDEEILRAAKRIVNTANPGIIIRSSTLHRLGGNFEKAVDDPNKYGVTVFQWDCFDVTTGCDRDCAKCLPEFGGRKIRGWAEWRKKNSHWPHEGGYCEGKAKGGGGWRRIWGLDSGTIQRGFLDKNNLEEFEVEEMGNRASGGCKVLDAKLLDKSLRGEFSFLPGMPICATIDWGMKSWCAIHVLQQMPDKEIGVLQTEYYHNERDINIINRIKVFRKIYGLHEVFADASHPYENANLKFAGFTVFEVEFGKWKDFGAGWIKGLLEQGKLRLQGKVINGEKYFGDNNVNRLYDELKGWRKNEKGIIIKKDDHGPDSLLCGSVKFGKNTFWRAECQGGRKRVFCRG